VADFVFEIASPANLSRSGGMTAPSRFSIPSPEFLSVRIGVNRWLKIESPAEETENPAVSTASGNRKYL
jgi:hypothetical protein